MKIVNIDADMYLLRRLFRRKDVDLKIPEFVIEIVRPLEEVLFNYDHFEHDYFLRGIHSHNEPTPLPLSPIWKFNDFRYENIAALLHSIPIYLRNRNSKLGRISDNSIIDPLGAYYSNRRGDSPYIELYLTDIDSSAGHDDNHFIWLFAIVLIHELAHAALDIFNLEHAPESEKVFYYTEFGKWREESMANAVTLRIIKDYGNIDFYYYAKHFMQEEQPKEYALGVLMEDFRSYDLSIFYDTKARGVDSKLQQEWLNYVKGTPDWEGLKKWNKLLDRRYVYSFEGEFYSSEKELVYTIVKKELSDYEKKNGVKMSFNTFSSLFPNIIIFEFKEYGERVMAYEPKQKVIGDNEYENVIELADGDYSLYNWWNNEFLKKFINYKKYNIIEYNNY